MRWSALACLAVLLVGCDDSAESPATAPSPSTESGGRESRHAGVTNGRIVSARPAPRPPASWCADCDFSQPQDRAGDVALYLRRAGTNRSGATWIDGITVVSPRGTELRISCPEDFPCLDGGSAPRAEDLAQVDWQFRGWGPVVLGPGDDEITMSSQRDRIDVRSFEGRLRRSVRLRGLADDEIVAGVAWSPDRSLLAVATIRARVWVFDADGRRGEVVYMSRATGGGPIHLGDLAWSPTGEAVSVLESYEFNSSVYLVVLEPESEQPRQIYWWPSGGGGDETYLWSPDGRRVAVDDGSQLLELSIEDGRVLGHHQRVTNPVWRARSS